LRKRIETQPCFFLNVTGSLKIIQEYHRKYDGIDRLLDNNPAILDTFHRDLEKYGTKGGRESKFSSEQILRMAIVKWTEFLSLRDTVIRVAESDFLRNFCRIGFSQAPPNYSFLSDALKHVSEQSWKKINEQLFEYAKKAEMITGDSLRLDSTVSESNIHYPTDAYLLWDSFRVMARLMRQAREANGELDCGNRFHDKKIKRLFTFISTHGGRKDKSVLRKVDKAMRTLIARVEWIVDVGRNFVNHGRSKALGCMEVLAILEQIEAMLPKVAHVAQQSRRAWIDKETVPAAERIFSIFEEHTELLKRGKARQPIEFGHLVTIGQTREKFISFYAVEEQSRHDTKYKDEALKDHEQKFGALPARFAADKNYHVSPADTEAWEEKIGVYAVGKKGRRSPRELAREHDPLFKAAQAFRAGVEGSISVLKRAFGLKRCLNRGFKSFAASIGNIVFCHNLVLLALR
jgi:IS5 family transposase